jgi:hypothetical protein
LDPEGNRYVCPGGKALRKDDCEACARFAVARKALLREQDEMAWRVKTAPGTAFEEVCVKRVEVRRLDPDAPSGQQQFFRLAENCHRISHMLDKVQHQNDIEPLVRSELFKGRQMVGVPVCAGDFLGARIDINHCCPVHSWICTFQIVEQPPATPSHIERGKA